MIIKKESKKGNLMTIIFIPKLTGKCLKICQKIEKLHFLLLTLLLVGRLDSAETSSNSSFLHRQLMVLKPDCNMVFFSNPADP